MKQEESVYFIWTSAVNKHTQRERSYYLWRLYKLRENCQNTQYIACMCCGENGISLYERFACHFKACELWGVFSGCLPKPIRINYSLFLNSPEYPCVCVCVCVCVVVEGRNKKKKNAIPLSSEDPRASAKPSLTVFKKNSSRTQAEASEARDRKGERRWEWAHTAADSRQRGALICSTSLTLITAIPTPLPRTAKWKPMVIPSADEQMIINQNKECFSSLLWKTKAAASTWHWLGGWLSQRGKLQ